MALQSTAAAARTPCSPTPAPTSCLVTSPDPNTCTPAQVQVFGWVQGWKGPLTAAVTSGSLSATGDLLAQLLLSGGVAGLGGVTVTDKQQQQSSEGAQGTGLDAPASASLVASGTASQKAPYDWTRTARMFGFGCCFYGPYQYYWYNLLDHLMPVKTTLTFLAKVSANQLLLAPVTLSAVFFWNLSLSGRAHELRDKLTNDLVPTLYNGWKFWIPAASLNFYAIPVQSQVLYMSMCGVLWTAYLSHASVTNISGGGRQVAAVWCGMPFPVGTELGWAAGVAEQP
ncbi:MAG: hypothetical protein WDW36_009662 [Sanguina aurantia]